MTAARTALAWACTIAIATSAIAAPVSTTPPAQRVDHVVTANNVFAGDLCERLRGTARDLCFSPVSLFEAMAMAQGGARSATAAQILRSLQMSDYSEDLHLGLQSAVDGLIADSRHAGYDLKIRNALFHQKGMTFEKDFQDLLRSCYNARVHGVDFLGDPTASLARMEGWLDAGGAGNVRDAISPGMFDEFTQVVLVNTVHMKVGQPAGTRPAMGPREPRWKDPAEMRLARLQGVAAAAEDSPLSLVLFLTIEPDEGARAAIVEPAGRWRRVALNRTNASNEAAAPGQLIRTRLDLQMLFEQMKLTDAFGKSADFSAMTTDVGLYIASVVHGAWIRVTPAGVEAVAVTLVVFNAHDGGSAVLSMLP